MEIKVSELSELLEKKSSLEAECFPVDRYFLQPYLDQIFSLDPREFILYNLERGSNTYTVQLFLCLPELWKNINLEDLLSMAKRFINVGSYYSLIEFTYKYVEIDLIELLLRQKWIDQKIKYNLVDYILTSLYPNLIKTKGDYLFFDEGIYGIKLEDWIYIKNRLLTDKRIKPALTNIGELYAYVKTLRNKW